MSSTNYLSFSPFSANLAHFNYANRPVCTSRSGWREERKKYSTGKLGYASMRAESSRKWNSNTAEVARGWVHSKAHLGFGDCPENLVFLYVLQRKLATLNKISWLVSPSFWCCVYSERKKTFSLDPRPLDFLTLDNPGYPGSQVIFFSAWMITTETTRNNLKERNSF